MQVFHRTPYGQSILETGFRDGEGIYMTGVIHRGVWVSDQPLDFGQGAKGDDLLTLDIPDDVLAEYEWIEDGKPYREFLVPATLLNQHGLCDENNYDC